MKIQFLGTGSAFSTKNYHSNLLLTENKSSMLIDAGTDIRHALTRCNLSAKDIEAVYVSHAHADHAGGIEYLATMSIIGPRRLPIQLFCQKELTDSLWNNTWKGGLRFSARKLMQLDDYFFINKIKLKEPFFWQGIEFNIVPALHIFTMDQRLFSYGVMIHVLDNDKKIFITSDTLFTPDYLEDYYNEADIIIHDCETNGLQTGIHAHYNELRTLPDETKRKMLLWHYQDNVINNMKDWQQRAKGDGFRGMAEPLQVIDIAKM